MVGDIFHGMVCANKNASDLGSYNIVSLIGLYIEIDYES